MEFFKIILLSIVLFNAIILPNNLTYAQASDEVQAVNIFFDDDKASSLSDDFKKIDGR